MTQSIQKTKKKKKKVSRKESMRTDGNRIRWKRLFDLFRSLETLTIYTTDELGDCFFPFALVDAIKVIRNEIFMTSKSIKTVELKAVHRRGEKSWIWDAFSSMDPSKDKIGYRGNGTTRVNVLENDSHAKSDDKYQGDWTTDIGDSMHFPGPSS